MSSGFYSHARQHFAQGDIHWKAAGGDTFKCALVNTALYTVDISADEYLSSVAVAARAATVTLTTLEPTDGILDAANVTFLAVPAGAACGALVVYQWTGSDATSLLVMYIDTAVAGLPVTPTGVDIAVNWSDLTARIGKL